MANVPLFSEDDINRLLLEEKDKYFPLINGVITGASFTGNKRPPMSDVHQHEGKNLLYLP